MSRENSAPVDTGSRTQIVAPQGEAENEQNQAGPSRPVVGVLKLRGDRSARRQKVVWSEETVDNEGMGKKKSKICCIYHKPKAYDQSSDESSGDDSECGHAPRQGAKGTTDKRNQIRRTGDSTERASDSDSDSDGGTGDGKARPADGRPRRPARSGDHAKQSERHEAPRANRYDHQQGGSGK